MLCKEVLYDLAVKTRLIKPTLNSTSHHLKQYKTLDLKYLPAFIINIK